MRSEKEMYELILGIANRDERIKAVYMNGSRTNDNAPKDIFQDYDIVYVVEETESFIEDKDFIKNFGDILYMQYPDENPYYPNERDRKDNYGWLMQFTDGNRIDLTVESIGHAIGHIGDDKLCRVLLDKEQILPKTGQATDMQYYVKKPTEEQYYAVCNEFWWCTNNVAKGMWRNEFLYVQDMVNYHVRSELIMMLCWKAGIRTDWSVSVGKSSKYLYRWLDEKEWKELLATYSGCGEEEIRQAVFKMCGLFRETAVYVGDKLGYAYNASEGKAAEDFLKHVCTLPKDAEEVY